MTTDIRISDGTEIAVIGDIHEHQEQFEKLIPILKPSSNMIVVSVGDIYDKGFGTKAGDSITNRMIDLHRQGYLYAVRGNHELKRIRRAKKAHNMPPELRWWDAQPLALSFVFGNGTRLTVVHAGVKPAHKSLEDLSSDVEVTYVRTVDNEGKMIPLIWIVDEFGNKTLIPRDPNGRLWHDLYDGRFGYVASGHAAQKDGKAKFYNYSCNLDSCCFETGILTCQVFDQNGRKELITVTGEAAKPNLSIQE